MTERIHMSGAIARMQAIVDVTTADRQHTDAELRWLAASLATLRQEVQAELLCRSALRCVSPLRLSRKALSALEVGRVC